MSNNAPGNCHLCGKRVESCEGGLDRVRYGRGWTLKIICRSCWTAKEQYEKARRQMVEAACEAQERFTLDELEEYAKTQ